METAKLKKFAQFARRSLMEQVAAKLKQVIADNSPARREKTKAISQLEKAVRERGKEQVIERVAYTWFNRFCALRFMDVNRYTRIGIVSSAEGQFQPEILAEAKMGHIDENMVNDKIRQQVFALLDGKSPSHDPQGEAYRLLLVAACNSWHRAMSFLFEEINDYTELLMPDDLLSGNSILAHTREAMTSESVISHQPSAVSNQKEGAENCGLKADGSAAGGGVEVIGWLYQFYISEKKDAVFAGLKKNKKITPENIPAATQLFTPRWIVRYLVENSLGRLWMLNRPNSRLIKKMAYYIPPVESGECEVDSKSQSPHYSLPTTHLRISSPEEIRFCDPACGSGHILAYAFDLFYAMYEEEGYEPAEIPGKILTHNLYGIEIDDRAGALAAFALTMKARSRHRRFFRKPVEPNICVLKNIQLDDKEINDYMDFVGRDLFTAPLQTTLRQFEEADNFGSLIRPDVTDVAGLMKILESKNIEEHIFLSKTHQKVLEVLRQADYLSPKYHVVVTNPPYMSGKGMNGRLAAWLKDNYEDVTSDLFSAFIVRNTELTLPKGQLGFMSPFVWMFISSYKNLRSFVINQKTITSLVQLEYSGFDGATVPICTFTVENAHHPDFKGGYIKLSDFRGSENQGPRVLDAIKNPNCGWFYRSSAVDFNKVPGCPIAYWVSDVFRSAFVNGIKLGEIAEPRLGMATGHNDLYVREWSEVSYIEIGFDLTRKRAKESKHKWFPYNKGGDYRKWFGNNEFVVNWENDGYLLQTTMHPSGNRTWAHNFNLDYIFKPCLEWSRISSAYLGVRYSPRGFLFDTNGSSAFAKPEHLKFILSLLATKISWHFSKIINPSLAFQPGDLAILPVIGIDRIIHPIDSLASQAINLAKSDWNFYETSWDFVTLPLLNPDHRQPTLKNTYHKLRAHWLKITLEMQRLEEENNRIFIEAYGLQDELTPEVPLKEITLTCNPHYRYGVEECEVGSEKWEEMEARLLQDTMKEFVSYAVGCMFGRYSLDMPGLVLANQGEGIEEYHRKIREYQANECKKLSGTDRLAEIHGDGGDDLSGHTAISQRGALRSDKSDSQGSGVGSLQHSGGSGEAINSRVQKFFVDNTGFPSGSGNPSNDRSAIRLSPAGEGRTNPESTRGDQTHDLFSDNEAALTPHSPLPTSHFPSPTSHFLPDEDNVIPLLNADWFSDDITERFKQFLRVTFGEEHYEGNLTFIEQALNIKGKRSYTLRDYFLGEFYNDHVRRYKKRPIYWLFSSPKGSFNALIYMHRYQPYTASTVLSYLRDFKNEKLRVHKHQLEAVSISASASKSEKAKALKEIEKVNKIITELETYERDILYPLATKQVEIDLDDGVKVNYPKFGAALKKIPGLSGDSQ
jgi:type II restriction/modification system DNA methylase subunit YeeA